MAGPTLEGYITFLADVAGIPANVLPATAPIIPYSYNFALNQVYQPLACLPNFDPSQPSLYAVAVYSLATDTLINFAPDNPALPPPLNTFFADLRKAFGLNLFVAGVISSTSDQGTSQSMELPDFYKTLTLANFQQLKTPFGRQYLAIAQSAGPVWGLS